MAKVSIPCLVGRRNADGTTRWYWQPSATLAKAGWKPVPLGRDEDAAITAARARNKEVGEWKLGGARPAQVQRRSPTGTLNALIDRYRREVLDAKKPNGDWLIARSTRRTYETGLKRLDLWAGKHALAFVTRARVKALRNAMMAPEAKGGVGHHAAHQTLKMGRVLFRFAMDCDLVAANPFESFGLAAPDAREVIWSPQAREAITAAAIAARMPSLALAIMLGFAIGQREQDILALTASKYVALPEHKMQRADYAFLSENAPDGVPRGIRVRQMKTRAWVEVPVVGEVRRAVEANIARAKAAKRMNVILDDTRFTAGRVDIYDGAAGQTRFQRDFADVRAAAAASARQDMDEELAQEIETLQFRDLRRTCVVYLGELGLEDHEISAITGHDIDETRKILQVYMPRTTGRAARAIAISTARQAKDAADRQQEQEKQA